jgi:hypothetical protein
MASTWAGRDTSRTWLAEDVVDVVGCNISPQSR